MTNFTSMFTKTAGNVAQRRVNLIYSEEAVAERRKAACVVCFSL